MKVALMMLLIAAVMVASLEATKYGDSCVHSGKHMKSFEIKADLHIHMLEYNFTVQLLYSLTLLLYHLKTLSEI